MNTPEDDQAAPFNTIHQQVNTNTQDIQDNAEIIQTKVTGPTITLDGSVATFSGTDGVTIQSSGILIDDDDNITVPGDISAQTGGTTGYVSVGGVIVDHFIDAGNVGTTETNLYWDIVPANVFDTDGDKIDASFGGIFVSSATATRQVKVYFDTFVIFDTGALSVSLSAAWTLEVLIMRISATAVRYKITLATEGAALSAYTGVGELTGLMLSDDNMFKITGTSAGVGAATNDIVAKLGTISWHPGV